MTFKSQDYVEKHKNGVKQDQSSANPYCISIFSYWLLFQIWNKLLFFCNPIVEFIKFLQFFVLGVPFLEREKRCL